MADPAQIQGMDAKQIAELHIVERYLADQLSDEEAQAFEAYVEAHPEVTRDIENISRMKAGLAALRQRGELESLVKKQRRVPLWAGLAAAAAVVAIVVLPRFWTSDTGMPGVIALEPLGGDGQLLTVSARILVGRSRGEASSILTTPPAGQAVEITLDAHAETASLKYGVEVFRVSGTALDPVGHFLEVPPQPDGTLKFFMRSSELTAGNYVIRASAGVSEPAEFTLRVQDPSP